MILLYHNLRKNLKLFVLKQNTLEYKINIFSVYLSVKFRPSCKQYQPGWMDSPTYG